MFRGNQIQAIGEKLRLLHQQINFRREWKFILYVCFLVYIFCQLKHLQAHVVPGSPIALNFLTGLLVSMIASLLIPDDRCLMLHNNDNNNDDNNEESSINPQKFRMKQIALLSCLFASTDLPLFCNLITYPILFVSKQWEYFPLMIIWRLLFFTRGRGWGKYLSIFQTLFGLSLFLLVYSKKKLTDEIIKAFTSLIVIGLLIFNYLYGKNFTNQKLTISLRDTMVEINRWQSLFLFVYLVRDFLTRPERSPPDQLFQLFTKIQDLKVASNVVLYSLCFSLGQIVFYCFVNEFGALMYVLFTAHRQFLVCLQSLSIYGKDFYFLQWIGIFCIFGGLSREIRSRNDQQQRLDE